ncbi:MAG TPA: hypothetical protein VIL86_15925 [Tepidisphaeraceae bacterium]|jgi:hypothetical protein
MSSVQSPYPRSEYLRGIRYVSQAQVYPGSNGDVWSCAWADDDHVYSVADDCTGIDQSNNSNLAIFRVEGTPPKHSIALVNPMSEYGTCGQYEGHASWKGNGLTCVDGVLYLGVSQHSNAHQFPDGVQRAYDGSIVLSRDHGKTWSAKPAVGEPMWAGVEFSTPLFVQFGKDYGGAMDEYVYAVSNSGTWNNGNYLLLGRCRRDRIGNLSGGDWEFFSTNYDPTKEVGWRPSPREATPIFRHRGYTSMAGIQYLPYWDRFLLGMWAYADLDGHAPFDRTILWLYEAPKPWGPWKVFHVEEDWAGMAPYNPSFPAKWFEGWHPGGGNFLTMVYSGNFTGRDGVGGYSFITRRLELRR